MKFPYLEIYDWSDKHTITALILTRNEYNLLSKVAINITYPENFTYIFHNGIEVLAS